MQFPERLVALPDHNKLLVHHGYELSAYSLDVLSRIALGHSSISINTTVESLSKPDESVAFFRVAKIGHRTMGN